MPQSSLRFLTGDSEMAARIRAHDWKSTSLGPPHAWPASLRTTVGMLLTTRHPVFIFWGPELLCIYNDAYGASLGPEKHPRILGLPGKQAFPEIWTLVGGDIEDVLAGGQATWHENQLVPIHRNGKLEDVYWTYSYAAIDDDHAPNGVGGVLVLCTETTAHVLAQQRATSDLARMAQLFDQAPTFMAVLAGPTHRFEFVNPAYRRLLAGRDILGRDVVDAVPEVASQGYVELLDNVYASGRPYTALAAHIGLLSEETRQVEQRRLDFVYQPMLDEGGKVNGIFVVGVDVTERTEAERALEVSEEQLRLATTAGEVGLWDVDPIAETLYWPASVRRMFGIFDDRPVSMHDDFYAGIHPHDREATSVAYAKALDPLQRGLYDVEYRTIGRDDGVVRWVAAKGRGIFDGEGRCVRVIGTAVDITARKKNEARLKELNETLEKRLFEFLAEKKIFADIVDGTDALIQVLGLQFEVLAINRACIDEIDRVYGVRPQVGDNLLSLLEHLPQQREEVRQAWSRAFEGDGFVEEREFGDPTRARRWYQLHFRPLFSPTGEHIGAYQFVYDVTTQREAETRLAQAEAALQQAQKMEAVGLLTGGVAHDFNNILQALNTKFELIRRRPENIDEVRAWASSGIEVALRGARLTAQLLTFSRRQVPDIRPVHLASLLDNMHDLLRTTVGPEARLVVQCDDLWVQADSTQLEMALLNLAVNSRDAMPSGGVFTVQGARGLEEDFIELRIADTGSGMSEEVLAKAFEPFFTTKGIGKGSGLGLAQVYAMANRVGGGVRVDSDGKSGTTVTISLRRAKPTPLDSTPALPASAASVSDQFDILVVDDDHQVRMPLVDLLKSLGHRVLDAASGEEALAVLDEADVQILLCDFAMPGMNGVAVANLARASRPELSVVFMSGYADGDELRDAVGHNATMLRKPFDTDAVRRAIGTAAFRVRG